MHLFQIKFPFDPDRGSFEEYARDVGILMAVYYRNGQQLLTSDHQWRRGNTLFVQSVVPARDALSPRHGNRYVREWLRRVRRRSSSPPQFSWLGEIPESVRDCRCRRPRRYFLHTGVAAEVPPVRCGDCLLPVPPYRLPYPGKEEEHASLVSWEMEYRSCERLWYGGISGEAFAYRQLSSVRSPLVKFGRSLCRELERKTRKPFFYPLFLYRKHPTPRCPDCGVSWELDSKDWYFRYRCDPCRLLGEKRPG
jgi:predicted  nucleic acid-binding Zn ribbon protein